MPTEMSADFWNARAAQYHHTGWTDIVRYAFDQPARIAALKPILKRYVPHGGLALDFGCGTGDFSEMLATFCRPVYACDISSTVTQIARQRMARSVHQRVTVCDDFAAAEKAIRSVGPLDLVLTVTVLDHILDDAELHATLMRLTRLLKPGGIIATLEYAPECRWAQPGGYQRFSTMDEWRAAFGAVGCTLLESYGAHHPDHHPSDAFEHFRRDQRVRVLAHPYVRRIPGAKSMIRRLGANYAARAVDVLRPGRPDDVLRLMIWRSHYGNTPINVPRRTAVAPPPAALNDTAPVS